jgi:hypothetical protein
VRAPTCQGCGSTVLELAGQYERVDPLYGPGAPVESVGHWHASCLASSPLGEAWHRARLDSLRARRYRTVVELARWTVVEDPDGHEITALRVDGPSLALSGLGPRRRVAGGAVHAIVEDDVTLALGPDDAGAMAAMQEALRTTGRHPLLALAAALGIADRMLDPVALERGAVVSRGPLRDAGRLFVRAGLAYGVFVPDELRAHVRRS